MFSDCRQVAGHFEKVFARIAGVFEYEIEEESPRVNAGLTSAAPDAATASAKSTTTTWLPVLILERSHSYPPRR